jgi:regulator of replication initiation timing
MAKGKGKEIVPDPDSSLLENKDTTLQNIIDSTSVKFEGHPADAEEVEIEEGKETKEGEPEKKGKEVAEPAKEVTPEDKPPKENPPEKGKDKQDLDDPLVKAQEEIATLNKRISDTQRDFHSTRDENKKIRESNEKLSSQLSDLMVAITKQKAESPTVPKKDPMEEVAAAMEKTLDEIESIDPSSTDYRSKSVQAWNKVFGKFKDILDQTVDSRITAAKSESDKEREEQRKKDREERDENERTSKIHDYADDRATESGLEMKTNIEVIGEDGKKSKTNSVDYDLFWRFASFAVGETTDEKIDWTIKEVKRIKGDVATPIVRAKEKAINAQKNNSVLEKGGNKPPEINVPEKPMTLDEAMVKAQRQF